MTTTPTWEALFLALTPDDQALAMRAYWQELQGPPAHTKGRDALLDALARALRFRPQRVRHLPPEKLQDYLRRHCREVFYPADWALLFRCFYRDQRAALMAAFLDRLNIPHDGHGLMSDDTDPPTAEHLLAAARALAGPHDPAVIRHYLCVLHRMGHPTWAHVAAALAQLPAEQMEAPAIAAATLEPGAGAGEDAPLVLDQFTTLDRVLIDQIVATVSEEVGCLTPDELEDLIETVVALNGKRRRSLFHVGFMHGLMGRKPLEFHRPEFNDRRRGWYLAGVLAAKTRQGDRDAVRALLVEHARDFRAAAEATKGAGTVMANLLLDTLFEYGRYNEALTLLKGQLTPGALKLARRAYQQATILWRQQQPDAALPVLRLLRERLPGLDEQPERLEPLLIEVERRYGQCLQSNGDLPGARAIFERILDRVQDSNRPDLRADLGLIEGGFRALDRLRLPEDQAERDSMRAALSQGEAHFSAAVATYGERAANACYALAIKDYLFWADQAKDDGDARAAALKHVELALVGMRESESATAYEQLGLLGQALFMDIVLNMDCLVVGDSHKALAQWERIPSDAGIFPKQDIQHLLTTAELLNPRVAAQIAESVWRKRDGAAAWDILGKSAERLIEHSDYLESQLLQTAREPSNARAQRFGIWKLLVPVFLNAGRNALAEEGLDALESLTDAPDLALELLEWLRDSRHYDPVWSESDADWARVRLARAAGRDADCIHPLIALFHRQRDEAASEAAQTAQLLIDWRLAPEQGRALLGTLPGEPATSSADEVEQRLEQGAQVKILFVGGNEVQARYDASIREELGKRWPGLELTFEHTGWSANWGRDVDHLVRQANHCDAIVIMRMIRTILGRTLREKVARPWVACTGTGRGIMLQSIREAALIGFKQRHG